MEYDPNISATIFNIQRFCTDDGPGIRTTVFFKGCPLNCWWCHNPESKKHAPQLSYNANLCNNCLSCVQVCATSAHQNINEKHVFDASRCSMCTLCVDVCNTESISIIGKNYTLAQVLEIVEKDISFYTNSGGGITLSGGEPLSQPTFCHALLIKAKELGIHTCIETCGYVSESTLNSIMPYTDLFLFDIKSLNNEKHVHFTGVSNELILSNFEFLYRNNASIILRLPLIPSLNDTPNDLNTLKQFIAQHPNIKGFEIMPYHNMGISKARNIGAEYNINEIEIVSAQTQEYWRNILLQP